MITTKYTEVDRPALSVFVEDADARAGWNADLGDGVTVSRCPNGQLQFYVKRKGTEQCSYVGEDEAVEFAHAVLALAQQEHIPMLNDHLPMRG